MRAPATTTKTAPALALFVGALLLAGACGDDDQGLGASTSTSTGGEATTSGEATTATGGEATTTTTGEATATTGGATDEATTGEATGEATSTTGEGTDSEDTDSEGTDSEGTDSEGTDSEGTTTGEDLGDCADEADACVPPGVLVVEGGAEASCTVEGIGFPEAKGLFAYCLYFEMGYLGFGWSLEGAEPGYTCPPGLRYAPNDTTGYCLWEDIVPPAGATVSCDALLSEGVMSYHWTCTP